MQVTRLEIPEVRVHGQHGSAADEEFAARRQRRTRRCRGSRGRLLAEKLARCRNQCAQCACSLEHRAPAHTSARHIGPPYSRRPSVEWVTSCSQWNQVNTSLAGSSCALAPSLWTLKPLAHHE